VVSKKKKRYNGQRYHNMFIVNFYYNNTIIGTLYSNP